MTTEKTLPRVFSLALPLLCAVGVLGYWFAVVPLGGTKSYALLALVLAAWAGRLLADALGAARYGLVHTVTAVCSIAFLALAAFAGSITHLPQVVGLSYLALFAVCIVYRVLSRGREPLTVPFATRTGALLCLVAAVLVVLYYFAGAVHLAHPDAVGAVTPSQDFFWNVGNAETFLLGFPPQDLRYAGVTVTYHYLTELLAAGLSMLSGVSCYNMLAFYLPPALLCMLVAVLWELGGVLYNRARGKQWLLLLLVFGTGCAGLWKLYANGASPFLNSMLTHTLTNINSVCIGLILLAAFVALLFPAIQDSTVQPSRLVPGVLAFALLTFAKGPMAGIAAIAAVCVLVLFALRRGVKRTAPLVCAAVIGIGFFLVYRFFFAAGAAGSMTFSLTATLSKTWFANILARLAIENTALYFIAIPVCMAAVVLLYMPATSLVWVGTALRDVRRLFSAAPWQLFCHACVVGGMAAFLLFDHPNLSQIYFAFIASFGASVLAADALPQAWQALSARKPLLRIVGKAVLAGLLAVGVVTACFTYTGQVTRGVHMLQNGAQDAYAAANKAPLTEADEQAMNRLRELMTPDELFVTNRMHTGAALEGLSNVYTGLSGRRSYMESFKYAMSNMGVPVEDVLARVDAVQTLFAEDTTPARAEQLCADMGVSYVVYSRFMPGSTVPLAGFEIVFENEDVTIFKVAQAAA